MASGTDTWSYQWDTTSYSNGIFTIDAKATDDDDANGYDSVTVTIDNSGGGSTFDDTWSQYAYDSYHQGIAEENGPTNGVEELLFTTGFIYYGGPSIADGEIIYSSFNNRLFCGKGDSNFFNNNPLFK